MLESWKWQRPVNKNLFVINLIWKHLLSTKWKFQSFGRRERCFHWNQNGKWQIVVIWKHSGAIFVYISWITHSQKWWVLCSFAYLRWRRRDVCNFHMIYIDDIIHNYMCVIFWTWKWYIESRWIKWNKN